MRLLKRHWPIIPILIVAASLRWYDIGADYLDGDHAFISIRAIRIARYHETPLLGPPMAVGLWHSPLSVYLYAIPYAFSLDPRVARAFTGLMNVIALGLMYAMGARYFNRKAALAAALLYAIHPDMITAARAINNAQLGAPFAVAYVFTGLLGYCEDQRLARLAHLPLLSLAGQCHPHTFAIAPISFVLLASAWSRWPNRRRQIIFDFLVSGLIAAVLLAPWGIGFYQFAQQANLQSAIPTIVSNKGLAFTFALLYNALGGSINGPLRHVLPVMTIFGAVWLAARFLRNGKEWPSAAIVMGFFCLPIIALLLKIHLVVDYFWPTFPIAFLIPGLVIGGAGRARQTSGETSALWKWNGLLDDKYLRWIAAPAMIALAIAYLPYVVVHDWSEGTVSLNEQVAALDVASALARKTGRDLMSVVPNDYDYLMPWEMLREIETIETGRDARVILPGRGMPLPQNGSVLLGPADYADRPDIFSGGGIVFQHFRIVELPPADHFAPDLVSPKPFRLSNGATIFGFLRAAPASLPTAGQRWRVFMIWRVDSPMADEATVFAHLVNERGELHRVEDVLER
ncbi:MAG: glycosyltransferase family 39 protein, partial [Chloroflexota bacterium]